MTGTWMGLSIGARALGAAQAMLETAAHNTANASTDGYSRQRVRLVASEPYTMPSFGRTGLPGQLGTGVTVASIERVRDAFLDLQLRGQVSLGAYWDARRDQLAKVESLFPEPGGSGLGTALSRFWSAWHDLAADPASTAARAALVEQSGTLAVRFNRDADQLVTLRAGANDELRRGMAELNDLAAQVAALNGQIQAVVVAGDHANDLEDQRDSLLDRISALVPASVERLGDGTVRVLVGGTDLVDHETVRRIVAGTNAAGDVTVDWSTSGLVDLGAGRLSAIVEHRDVWLAGYSSRLDALAKAIGDAVNGLHATGFDATGAAGGAFFTMTAGREAATLRVSAAIVADPRRVAAASAAGLPGDASIAGAIADLRTAALLAGGTQAVGDAYAGLVGSIGSDSRQAQETATNQGLVVDHLRLRRESISGVSLDEEAADMLRFQRAYQAAARVITAVDEMLDQLINRTGIVGR